MEEKNAVIFLVEVPVTERIRRFLFKLAVNFGGSKVRKKLERVSVGFGDGGSVNPSTDCLLLSQCV